MSLSTDGTTTEQRAKLRDLVAAFEISRTNLLMNPGKGPWKTALTSAENSLAAEMVKLDDHAFRKGTTFYVLQGSTVKRYDVPDIDVT